MDSNTLFAEAMRDLDRGFTIRGETRLRQAAAAGHDRAGLVLARRFAERAGPGAAQDPQLSALLEQALTREVAEAFYFRAALRYGAGEKETAREDLNRAAAARFPPAQTALALGWFEHETTEARGNGLAWLARAAANGDKAAVKITRAMRSRHDGGNSDPPLADPPLLASWANSKTARNWQRLTESPVVKYADNALSPLECAWLRTNARPRLRPSMILDPLTRRAKHNPVRTSTEMNFGFVPGELFLIRLIERIASGVGLSAGNVEPLTVLRYCPGQQYHPHRDAFGREKPLHDDPLAASGDRPLTALVYLNEPGAGGATCFPKLNLEVAPTTGRLLVFHNTDASDAPDDKALHAGMPVTAGTKWLASLWFRERPIADSFRLQARGR